VLVTTRFDSLRPGGEPFPGYRLRHVRGRGAFAEVWEASAPDGSLVALKFIRTSTSTAAREVRATQSVRQLSHPGLIRVDQTWCETGGLVVCMELADGSLYDLHEVWWAEYGTCLDPDIVCTYLRQAAECLDFLNARRHTVNGVRVGFQHCDIKPGNLLILGGSIKLADFGLATPTSGPLVPFRQAGTLEYCPPEVFQGNISDRSDQYALAVSWVYLRTGHVPFSDTPRRFEKTYVRPAPDLSRLTPAERPIVLRALSPAPQARWPTCSAFMDPLCRLFVGGSARNGRPAHPPGESAAV
jgi:serine/threonine protein kinase